MLEGPITFDRVARWALVAGGIIVTLLVINKLSAVLLPFFVAWLFAYLLYPVVCFIQYRLKVKVRALSIVLAMILVGAVLTGIIMLIIPPLLEECGRFAKMATNYLHNVTKIPNFPEAIRWWVEENGGEIQKFLTSDRFTTTLKETMPQVFSFMSQTVNVVMSITASFITLLYMFFILLDYETLSTHFVKIFPRSMRPFVQELTGDVKNALNSYIRGQGMVATVMGVLFCIGFSIIGLPMAIGLGILIGIMDMVPYLHTIAIIPAALLAMMKAAETGDNVWFVLVEVVAIFCIVQIIIEAWVNPKIMGKQMGLNPAVLLLSLSIWGALLGFIGLIIALPATTIIIAYWQRYVAPVGDEKTQKLRFVRNENETRGYENETRSYENGDGNEDLKKK